MSYIRYFMPMISEATGYGFKGRHPAGRSIVESRSHGYKLTIWAQDLKTETFYNTYLLFADSGRYAGIGMGRLPVDEKGKGELRRDFDEDTLCGFALTEIVAVAVIAKDAAGVVSPLCGYKDSVVSWRHGFYEHVRVTVAYKHEEVPMVELSVLCEETPCQQHDEVSALWEDGPAPQPDGLITCPMETFSSQSETTSVPSGEMPILPDETPCHPPEEAPLPNEEWRMPIPQTPEPQMAIPLPLGFQTVVSQTSRPDIAPQELAPTHNTATQGEISKSFRMALDRLRADTRGHSVTPVHQINQLDAIFETKEPIFPFQSQARETAWVSFTLSDQVPPPANKPRLFEDPFIHTAIAEYEHLILGMTIDHGPRRYIIGVPGVYNNESRHKARRLGFTQFKPCNTAHPSWGELGYWLMFVSV